jgi:hypothetical protein
VRVGVQPLAGDIPDHQLAMVVEANDARREKVAHGIGEYSGSFAIPGSHEAVGGAQVDTNDHSHFSLNDAAGQQSAWVARSVITVVPVVRKSMAGDIGNAGASFNMLENATKPSHSLGLARKPLSSLKN